MTRSAKLPNTILALIALSCLLLAAKTAVGQDHVETLVAGDAGCELSDCGSSYPDSTVRLTPVSEPDVTSGDGLNSNTVFFRIPEFNITDEVLGGTLRTAHAFAVVRKKENNECVGLQPDQEQLDLINIELPFTGRMNLEEILLESGVEYTVEFALKLFVTVVNFGEKIVCLPFGESITFKQDAEPPFTQIDSVFSQLTCLTDSSFDIPFKVWDEISGAVDRATLWVRHEPDGEWVAQTPLDTLFSGSSKDSAGTANYPHTRTRDGYHGFLITARDTARHPEWTPENPLTDGNESDTLDTVYVDTTSLFIDTVLPESRVVSLPDTHDLLCFDINYTADDPRKDEYESGLAQVTLYYRHESMTEFRIWQAHVFEPPMLAQADSMFEFKADRGDGIYGFYAEATDAGGNVQPFHPDSVLTTEVQATPRILHISPDTTVFHHASDVDSIEVLFDRIVSFADSACILQVTNQYNKNHVVDGACRTEVTPDSATKLIWYPDSSLSTSGWFEVAIDLSSVQTRDPACGLQGQSRRFDFYTFMEIEQGGSILTPSFQVIVPQGAPSDAIVIMDQGAMGGPCGYEGATRIQGSRHGFDAFRSRGLSASIEIPGTLGFGYGEFSLSSDPRALRIFEQLPEGCLPAGEKETWRVATDISFVFATVENINSEFFLVSIGATGEDALANYPNPFGDGAEETKITYTVTDPSASLSLRIYDQFGNLVKAFRPGELSRHFGLNECPWNGRNDLDELVASGGYICVFENGSKKYIRKIAVLR